MNSADYRAVVLGGSAGALHPTFAILSPLPDDYPLPVLLAQHLHKTDDGRLAQHLATVSAMPVAEACDKEPIEAARVYVAPADYHLLVERDRTLALSVDPRVNWSRPSIDVLFESAARAWAGRLICVLLSGANDDGARGMELISEMGGFCIVQDPETAESTTMPRAAAERVNVDAVLPPAEIGQLLLDLAGVAAKSQSMGHTQEPE